LQVTSNDMDGVPHHLLDVVDPPEGFSVLRYKYVACRLAVDGFFFWAFVSRTPRRLTRFREMALAKLDEIHARGALPVVVGGTSYYIQVQRIQLTCSACTCTLHREAAAANRGPAFADCRWML
jgi:tRNA dimethylallyltransferase